MKSTSLQTVSALNSVYVNPSHSTTPTTYFLSTAQNSSVIAANWITDVSTSGKRSFTYNSGYGGVGSNICLSGYPSNPDFGTYTISGSWGP